MNKSDSIKEPNSKNIYQRMHAVMQAVSYVQKEDKKVNNQYTFVSHDAVTAKIRPALIENGIITVPRVIKWQQDGNRTEADIEIDFVNIDKPEERVTVSMFGFGIDPQDKGPGKAISYAVKYALLKAFSLETGDDPERDQHDHKPSKAFESPHKPTDGAWEAMSEDEQVFLTGIAMEVIALIGQGDVPAAYERLEREKLDGDEKVALWTRLDSKQRSALKKHGEALKNAG